MRRRVIVVLAAAGALAPAGRLHAQRPVTVGVGGGVSLPQGRFGDAADPGWRALGALWLGGPMHLLGLRLDGAYDRFGAAVGEGARSVASGTLNVTYRLPAVRSPLSPFVIAGAGAYRLACSGGASCPATTRFGWNGGLGTRFAGLGLRGLVEARYHRVALPGADASWFPLTLGLTF